ncbi:MAG TPA: flavodoxin family protein [Candidatus Latescibacteria bacterium]|nr:flavodoxin family protein [Candidatus Latescibacterota bacterium]
MTSAENLNEPNFGVHFTKVLVVSCSPRKDGNTELLLEEAAKGVSDAGADVEFIRISELRIHPCLECLACHKDGRCVVDDDMQVLYPKLVNMHAIILGSPIFFMSIPAQGKAFIDRCQPFWAMKYLLGKELVPKERTTRKGAFIFVGGTKLSHLFEGAIWVVKSFFKVIEVEYEDELLFRGIDEEGEVLRHLDALKLSYELGRRIVSSVRGRR